MQNQNRSLNLYCNMLYTVCITIKYPITAPFLGQTNGDLNFKVKNSSNLWSIAKPVGV